MEHMGSDAAIAVHNLRKVYGNKAAVDGLDLEVPRGCFFGFLGPNGAGKTTTIRMLMGLAPPTSGTIELLGLPMPEHALEVKGKIGLVPDETLLFDHLTGLEFTEFVGRMYGLARPVARERSRELLALFELDGEPGKLIGDYSKGMRKRVAMAAALIHRPELFLLDEPFEGVDAVGAQADEGDPARSSAARRNHVPDLARAGSGGAPVRPGGHYPRRQAGEVGHHGRAANRLRDARKTCSYAWWAPTIRPRRWTGCRAAPPGCPNTGRRNAPQALCPFSFLTAFWLLEPMSHDTCNTASLRPRCGFTTISTS